MRILGIALSFAVLRINGFAQDAISPDHENVVNNRVIILVLVAAGESESPQAGAVVNISYPGGAQERETNRLGRVAFDLPVDASLASIIVSHTFFPEQRIGYVHWKRTAEEATATVKLRNSPPFPLQVFVWNCTGVSVRRSCTAAAGAVHTYAPGASTPAVQANLKAGAARIDLPRDPMRSEFLFVSPAGGAHFFASPTVDWSVDPPAAYLVVDEVLND